MEFGLKWVCMGYELIVRLDGALWLTIVSKPPLPPTAKKGNKKIFVYRCLDLYGPSCGQGGLEMIVSHRAPSSLI